MITIKNDSHDPYFNQAFEEYVLEHFTPEEDILLLWINEPCVVCGRYQNLFQEVNLCEAAKRNIPVIRRNTGGGTVYHDRGNLNYTMIRSRSSDAPLDYDAFLHPVIEALNRMGVPAHKRNVCDIAIENRKISGSAQSVKSDRVLHHGTLLFDANLSDLKALLCPMPGKMESKAVKSVPSPVTNIKEHLGGEQYKDINEFEKAFQETLLGQNGLTSTLSEESCRQIEQLSQEKYRTWEWNFGKGPKFTFYPEHTDLCLCVERGIVVQCNKEALIGLPADRVIKEINENEKDSSYAEIKS